MSFFEDIANALDADGIESRVHNDILFVPISPELEVQFHEIDPLLPAANVYIATADSEDDDFDAVLTSVVFSVEDAVTTVASYVVTDQIVTVMRDLLEGTDERIEDIEFEQGIDSDNTVWAPLTDSGVLRVGFDVVDQNPVAHVSFETVGIGFEDALEDAQELALERAQAAGMNEREIAELLEELTDALIENRVETLELGVFDDFDKLFDVISLAADNAELWENQLGAVIDEDEAELYDLFGTDDEDDDDDEFYFEDAEALEASFDDEDDAEDA
ncbi:DNA primase [Corynebacterium sp. HS2168-gen11]|uniref:DNA primase n=1 Tax=Corynebacterium sp. HS2168-gen11 TaxID=2974027 RepID=UPI00216AB4A0|nr:DNA primase [Corynebacterium sp. HS2168-gen11]MCS4534904.1 DNA primase [Corynebacterium sp. HS2168-gen11]